MNQDKSLNYYTHLAEWMDDPIPPGKGRALALWLETPSNKQEWAQWKTLRAQTKELQTKPPDLEACWGELRDGLGFQRSTRARVKTKSKPKVSSFEEFWKKPIVAAISAMILLGLFLTALYLLRSSIGFTN